MEVTEDLLKTILHDAYFPENDASFTDIAFFAIKNNDETAVD